MQTATRSHCYNVNLEYPNEIASRPPKIIVWYEIRDENRFIITDSERSGLNLHCCYNEAEM